MFRKETQNIIFRRLRRKVTQDTEVTENYLMRIGGIKIARA
jgi:hypothetical protein